MLPFSPWFLGWRAVGKAGRIGNGGSEKKAPQGGVDFSPSLRLCREAQASTGSWTHAILIAPWRKQMEAARIRVGSALRQAPLPLV